MFFRNRTIIIQSSRVKSPNAAKTKNTTTAKQSKENTAKQESKNKQDGPNPTNELPPGTPRDGDLRSTESKNIGKALQNISNPNPNLPIQSSSTGGPTLTTGSGVVLPKTEEKKKEKKP